MTDIRDRAGARWFAGLMLAMLILSMGNGFAVVARAQEVPADPPAEESVSTPSEEVTPEPEAVVEEESVEEDTPEENIAEEETPVEESQVTEEESNNETQAPPGEDGANGANGNATSTSDGAPSDITTGDAEAGAAAGGIVNVTDVDTNASSTPPSQTASTTPTGEVAGAATSTPTAASSTPSVAAPTASDATSGSTPEPQSTPENSGSGSGHVDITHTLTASTTLEAEGNTGDNTINDPDGGVQDTGDGTVWGQDNFFFNIALVDSSLQIQVLLNPTESELDFRDSLLDFFSFGSADDEDSSSSCVRFYNCKNNNELTATSTNSAVLERNMDVLCNSGANYGGLIGTGDCQTSGVMTTMGNWFAFNSNLMVLLVNQVGDLHADVVLPEPSFFENLRKGTIAKGSTLQIDQTASTTVNGAALANSGENIGEEGVGTGTAEADAATLNMINQLNPLSCFIVAVGGTWHGDIYQLPQGFMSEDMPFGKVVCGRGGATGNIEAINAVVKNDLEMVVNALSAANTGHNSGEAVMSGDAKSFLAILNVVNSVFINQDWILGLFTVSGDWDGDLTFGARPDASPAEQAASDIVSGKTSSAGKKAKSAKSKLQITKTASASVVVSPAAVGYTLTLKNNGGKIYGATLTDTLKNPVGTVIHTQEWDLGTIDAGEEIVVEYSVEFNGSLLPGNYTNTAEVNGRLASKTGPKIIPVRDSVTLELLGGEVLGVQDCPAYLTDYVTVGGTNDPEQVRLLESFLSEGRGESVVPDGTYDQASIDAVKRFQSEYADEILTPWGMSEPTGNVYFTTRKAINELYCNGEKEFPLSSFEVRQIQLYRNGLLQPNAPTGLLQGVTPWSATDFPFFSGVNSTVAPVSTPAGFFSQPFTAYPLLTLLRDIFGQLASGFGVGYAHAAQ